MMNLYFVFGICHYAKKESHAMDINSITTIATIATSVGAVLSGVATTITIFVAYQVHKNQKLLAQRQLLLPLWEHMATLRKIDPANPITPDVIKAVNTLELVALCCEGGMIDENIIKRTFKEQFMMHYEDIKKCRRITGLNDDGEKLLNQNRAATQFYISLNQEHLNQDKVKKA